MSAGLQPAPAGMSRRTAGTVEAAIIILCALALAFIVQPFSLALYGVGAGLVVLGGLAFNLVPFCRPGVPAGFLVRVAGIVLLILAIVVLLALGFTELYSFYLAPAQPFAPKAPQLAAGLVLLAVLVFDLLLVAKPHRYGAFAKAAGLVLLVVAGFALVALAPAEG